jgi:hypothetical protein
MRGVGTGANIGKELKRFTGNLASYAAAAVLATQARTSEPGSGMPRATRKESTCDIGRPPKRLTY